MVKSFKKNLDKKEGIIDAIRDLQNSIGWEVLLGALNRDINNLQTQLDEELDKPEQDNGKVKSLHIRKKAAETMKDLPNTIIETVSGAPEVPVELDPYEK